MEGDRQRIHIKLLTRRSDADVGDLLHRRVSNTPKLIDAGLCVNVTKSGYTRLTVAAGSAENVGLHEAQVACPLIIVDETDRLTINRWGSCEICLIGIGLA